MSICSKLGANIIAGCDTQLKAGVSSELYLINFEDWENGVVTYDSTDGLAVTEITVASGEKIYKVKPVSNNTIIASHSRTEVAGLVRYSHSVQFPIEQDDVTTKQQIRNLDLGKYVAIVFTNSKVIEVYGADAGLRTQDGDRQNRSENGGVYTIILQSDEAIPETDMPKSYIGASSPYDFATAKADLDAQLAA